MTIYEPAEDSFMMSDVLKMKVPKLLKENPNLKFLEIGVGSGINLQAAMNAGIKKENIFGTDINPEAVEYCKTLGFACIRSDLFENLKGGDGFDIIIFNPPYLPLDERETESSRIETTGGKKGNETTIRFFKQAKNHLTENGKIFVITSSLAEPVDFEELGYKAKIISEKNLFFERIFLWECL